MAMKPKRGMRAATSKAKSAKAFKTCAGCKSKAACKAAGKCKGKKN